MGEIAEVYELEGNEKMTGGTRGEAGIHAGVIRGGTQVTGFPRFASNALKMVLPNSEGGWYR